MKFSSSTRPLISLLVVAISAALVGCPQTMVKRIEQLRPPPNYRPVYTDTTVEISADTLIARALDWTEPAAQTRSTDTTDLDRRVTDSPPATSCIVDLIPRQLDDQRYPEQIVFDVVVTDTAGRFVTGLAPPYYRGTIPWRSLWFWLSDSCREKQTVVDSFTVEELRKERSERYAVAFVLDHSPSMGEARIVRLRQAIAAVLKEIVPGDAVSVITFGGRATVEIPITTDSAVYGSFHPLAGEMISGTAIYDAVATAVDQLRKVPPQYRRVIILLTDGGDNSSRLTLQQAVRRALDSAVTVYTIGYGWIEEEPLRLLAQGTHGQMYRIYSVREFSYIFARIYRALRSYYRVRYRPPDCAGLHTVRLGLRIGRCSTMAMAHYDRSVMTALDTVGTIVFMPIEFDYDRATIRPESLPLLERIAEAMKTHPQLRIEVRGHTDDRGSEDYNLRLSQRRADAVVEALVQMGVERSRLRAVGFGESRPLVENTSEENRARNRRTEFVIISTGERP